ncbi:VOC family protein [Alphaproteobacteria bacterium]|mgnify:FL=1|jgi:catechol 2,3-dioxygenase-like lactoylglutathione lyase family enzyme|nr:VOC family protein [Alphaproteobacteria bacterium]
MIGYVTLGSNDKDKAAAFYDALMGEIGGKRIFNNDRLIFWGTEMGAPMIGVGTPYDGEAATVGNGTMVALSVGSRENVDKLYAKAIALGAQDEGAPGERMPGFYGAYFRDLDGNKFVAFMMG